MLPMPPALPCAPADTPPQGAGVARGTPMAFIRAIVAAYAQAGMDPADALRHAGIAPTALQHLHGRVPAQQMEALSAAAMRELDDEALGWFSRPLRWGSIGMLCRASLPSPDLHIALTRWCRHHALLVDDIRIALSVDGGVACIRVTEQAQRPTMRELCLVSTLRNLHGFACWLVSTRIPLLGTTFPYPAPGHADAYPTMFGQPVQFDAPCASIRFDAAHLALSVRRSDADLCQMLLRPLPLVVWPYRPEPQMARRVRDLLRTHGPAALTAQALADDLGISVRSLHRHLADEGAPLQHLKDALRRDIAIDRLTRTSKPLKQVAAAAGYRSKASFNRAFRGWTGRSPAEYRPDSR